MSKNDKHHRAKLSNEQVRKMRQDYKPYVVGFESLAIIYGCGISTARDICTFRTRKDVK